jgi:flagellar hook capping protein FlgD
VFDTAPPAAPSGVAAALQAGGGIQLTWAPNAESDLAGYIVYRASSAGGPYVALNSTPLTSPGYVDGALPPGAAALWYQVSARDLSGNESARSSAASVSLSKEAGVWTAEAGYPNPSRAGSSVRIPVVVPEGAGEARIEVVNNVGQRVRRMDLGVLPAGATEIQWDGRNDAGREVAPGAYTGWLIAGSSRLAIRMVRLP